MASVNRLEQLTMVLMSMSGFSLLLFSLIHAELCVWHTLAHHVGDNEEIDPSLAGKLSLTHTLSHTSIYSQTQQTSHSEYKLAVTNNQSIRNLQKGILCKFLWTSSERLCCAVSMEDTACAAVFLLSFYNTTCCLETKGDIFNIFPTCLLSQCTPSGL